jgi:antitoxin component of RelBE/YafQ-DinJ toxin-antitoxin module
MKTKMMNIRMDSELLVEFKKKCEMNGYSLSKRIRILIKKDINEK